MWTQHLPAMAEVAALPFSSTAYGASRVGSTANPETEVAAPFAKSSSFIIDSNDVLSAYHWGHYASSSSAKSSPVTFKVQVGNETPADLVGEFRRISGLTWLQVAEVFDVSQRAAFDWASGKTVSAKNHHRLGEAVAALRYADRGSASQNKNLLLSNTTDGRTFLSLLNSSSFEDFKEEAGEGAGRPNFNRRLSHEGERFNAPSHFGRQAEAFGDATSTDVVPLSKPALQRVKARKKTS
jgi:hypothetical protein